MKKYTATLILLFIFGLVIGENNNIDDMPKNKMSSNHFINPELLNKYDLSNSHNIQHLKNSDLEESLVSEQFQANTFDAFSVQDSIVLDSILSYESDGDGWEPSCFLSFRAGPLFAAKTLFTYDENGHMTKCVEEDIWPSMGDDFFIYQKDEYTYNENGNQATMNNYLWDDDSNDYVNNSKGEYTYDENGNLTKTLHYYWDIITNDWVSNNIWWHLMDTLLKPYLHMMKVVTQH